MREAIDIWLILIPALPLAAAIICGVLGAKVLKEQSHWPVIIAFAAAFVCSLLLLREVSDRQSRQEAAAPLVAGYEHVTTLWTWATVPDAYDLHTPAPGVVDMVSTTASSPAAQQNMWENFRIDISLRADALTCVMLCMVTFVATLVAIFAAGYMHGDRGYWRFFAYIGIFVFSMTMLVSVSNFVLLFVFWEAVGACSYLLIGFWYQKPEAAAAGKKAFLVNRVGDFGFLLGLFLIWTTYGTLNFHDSLADGTTDPQAIAAAPAAPAPGAPSPSDGSRPDVVRGVLGQSRLATGDYVAGGLATAICLLLLLGACGKSAQFPLHVWLPDAMEGPTPVSALIHAATMVTAGVYMVTRCSPLFTASPTAQVVVAIVGAFTALMAGLIALTQFDLKRVLAYSTVSQLGYMFLALGVGTYAGITSGMYHLFTHAFFKALLFLGAGSVMHAMGNVIDMRQFGGLRKLMPYTHWTFLIGSLALAGIFPLAGFWSKDAILGAVHDRVHAIDHEIDHRAGSHAGEHPPATTEAGATAAAEINTLASWSDAQLHRFRSIYTLLYYSGVFTAFLTAFYTFRAVCMTFYGEERIPHQAGHHAHESPPLMVVPLAILAVAAAIVGLGAEYGPRLMMGAGGEGKNLLTWFLGYTPSLAAGTVAATRVPHTVHLDVAGVSTIVAVLGVLLAMYLYLGESTQALVVRRFFDWQGLNRYTDPQWVTRLENIGWIGAVTRPIRKAGLGFLVNLLGYVLGILSLLLAIPLALGNFVTPYKLSYGKFFIDQFYDWAIIKPLRLLAVIAAWLDRNVLDGLVNLAGWIPAAVGSLMRSLQMGLVQFYALAMVLGVIILIFARMMYAAG